MEIQNIKLDDLKVSTTNPRFVNTVIDEVQAIFLLINQDMDKMKNLFISISKEGFLPIPFYVFINKNETIVMDGNRRLSALKLIKNPNLLPDNDKYIELKNIVKNIKIDIPLQLPCIVFRENNDQLWDTLLKLHISDESKLIWSPLAQYTMSKRLGGNKYKYMLTLLNYFDIDTVEKITLDNADSFTRLFTAISTRNVKIDNGKISLDNENDESIKMKLQKLVDLITSKILNTRTPQKIYEEKVEQILLGKNIETQDSLKLELQISPNSFYEGQVIDFEKIKYTIINGKNKIIISPPKESDLKFINLNNQEVNKINTDEVGVWKLKISYLGEELTADININKRVIPNIKFINSMSYIQLGESEDLRKFISSSNNSYNQDMSKKIHISANTKNNFTADIVNTTFTGKNKKGIYEICYQFEDVDGSPISKIYQIEVGDFFKEKIKAVQTQQYPLSFDTSVCINIEPVVNDLINEIQSLNFVEHQSVISCSIRSILELTLDELERKGYFQHKNNFIDRLRELIAHLKQVAVNVICNVKKSKYYTSFNGLNNILDVIDVNKINAVVNLGAHKSKKLLNQTTFEETINKDIVQLLNIINEYIN